MRPPISHPVTSIGVQNKQALDTLSIAYSCALQLAENGLTVLRIIIENCKPVIWVQPEKRCDELNGVEYKWRGRESTMQANINGCRVQWKKLH